MNNLVTIRTFSRYLDAQLAKGLLDSSGIEADLRADDLGGMDPLLVGIGPGTIRLLVNPKNADKARELLAMK